MLEIGLHDETERGDITVQGELTVPPALLPLRGLMRRRIEADQALFAQQPDVPYRGLVHPLDTAADDEATVLSTPAAPQRAGLLDAAVQALATGSVLVRYGDESSISPDAMLEPGAQKHPAFIKQKSAAGSLA
ncbi:MAG: hypothetical protein GKR94_00940 [Gammaproteobacteria bacterium]|nr:hypothetical protein [Gammaproteobacteria bacterium]